MCLVSLHCKNSPGGSSSHDMDLLFEVFQRHALRHHGELRRSLQYALVVVPRKLWRSPRSTQHAPDVRQVLWQANRRSRPKELLCSRRRPRPSRGGVWRLCHTVVKRNELQRLNLSLKQGVQNIAAARVDQWPQEALRVQELNSDWVVSRGTARFPLGDAHLLHSLLPKSRQQV